MSTFFCSDLARAEKEQLFGTAKQIRVFIALEYWPAWKSKAIQSDLLPDEVRRFAAAVRERIPEMRFLLVRRKESKHRKPSCFVALPRESDPAVSQFELGDYRDLESIDVDALLAGTSGIPRRSDPLYLVCTHAQHDKCCAKYGNAVRDAAGGELWESSHLGGCRFAANLLCLPHGLLFGYLGAEEAARVVQEHSVGRIFLPNFRGRHCFPKPVQAADYFIRRETGTWAIDGLRFVDTVQTSPASWTTRFSLPGSGRGFAVEHTAFKSGAPRLLSCTDTEPEFVWTNQLSSFTPIVLPG